MYEIEQLSLEHLKPKKKELYQKMLNQGYKHLFDNADLLNPANKNLIAISTTFDKVPVGLLIAEKKTKEEIEVKSMYVDEQHKSKNLLCRMLKHLEKIGATQGGRYLQALYPNSPSFIEEWEKAFTQAGWTGRRLAVVECYYADKSKFHPGWYEKEYRLPQKFEIFPWSQLKHQEADEIKQAYQRKEIPDEVYPFAGGGAFETLNSLGLRYDGKVIGWLITRKLDSDTICYYSIYVEYEFHNQGLIIQLLIKALKLQQNSPFFKKAIFRVNILQLPNLKWLRFVRRRLAPHADQYTEYYLAWHSFNK